MIIVLFVASIFLMFLIYKYSIYMDSNHSLIFVLVGAIGFLIMCVLFFMIGIKYYYVGL